MCFVLFSVSNLHERWSKACGAYRDIYGQLLELSLSPSVDWNKVLSDKQVKSPPSTATVNKTLLTKHQPVKNCLFRTCTWIIHVCVCVFLQKSIQGERYGPSLSDVEKQIAAHNILHKEIEAYRSALLSSDVS